MKRLLEKVDSCIGLSFLLFMSLIVINSNVYAAPKTVNFGNACALSGAGAVYGLDFARGFQLAIDEINAKGGIKIGQEKYIIKGITYDTELKPALSIKMALRLSSLDKCPVVFVAESTGALSVMKYNEKEKFLLMAVTTTPEFTQVGNKLGVRIALSFAHHVDMMTREAWKRGVRKVAVYTRSFETSKRWGAHFENVWQAKGGQIVAREESAMNSSDHYSRITKLMTTNPDAILVPSWSDEPASVVLKQARELGFKGKFLFTEAMEGVRLLTLVSPKESEGTLLVQSQSSLDSPALRAFRQRYMAKYPDGVFQSAGPKSYEGVYMVAAAMEKAGTVSDVFKIRAAMPSVTPVPEEYRAAGFLKVTPEGDVGGISIVFEFKNGKRELVAQSDSFAH